ncbi:hypothetical protein Sjap_013034 [Stephania japonica]|uniref:Protein kinase domain-containing protein n=1 Tax=Stephania japonica TaxID=461633 RepID=A0AAP0IX06_9MAGN
MESCLNETKVQRLCYVNLGSLSSCFHSGYLAPEYAIGSKLTKKVDLCSFGVLTLELICG